MQETKTNALGIRITDGELRRLEAIKGQLGLPSMTNTTLGHDLLIMGIQQMEMRANEYEPGNQAKRKAVRKRSGEKPPGQPAEGSEV
jgi:hypothetical protein